MNLYLVEIGKPSETLNNYFGDRQKNLFIVVASFEVAHEKALDYLLQNPPEKVNILTSDGSLNTEATGEMCVRNIKLITETIIL